MGKQKFSFMDRLRHYTDVASGKKATKKGSKFSDSEQRAYARGQRDALNKQRCTFAFFKKRENEKHLSEKPKKAFGRKNFDQIYLESVGSDFDTKGEYKKSFEDGYNYVLNKSYSEKDYERSKDKLDYAIKELKNGNSSDRNFERDKPYLLKTIAGEKGSIRAYEDKYKKVMREEYPKDILDDDPFVSALLDSCEKKSKTKK